MYGDLFIPLQRIRNNMSEYKIKVQEIVYNYKKNRDWADEQETIQETGLQQPLLIWDWVAS